MPDKRAIPDYYRQFTDPVPERRPAPEPPAAPPALAPRAAPAAAPQPAAPLVETRPYRADAFTLALPTDGWRDQTIFQLAGPIADGLQHQVTVTVDPGVPPVTLAEYAAVRRAQLEDTLQGCHVLLDDEIALDAGIAAARLVYRWWPSETRRLYQEQLHLLVPAPEHPDGEQTGYTLTATFTRKTRRTHGPAVERVMRSFAPHSFTPDAR